MKHPLIHLAVIASTLALFGLLIVAKGLKPGLDLAGGTTLVYDVQVPENADADQVIDDTILILSKRVDPTGTMNLTWRQVAGNRIEVQMALASKDVGDKRKAFQDQLEKLADGNIKAEDLDNALQRDEAARSTELARLAGDDSDLLAKLNELATLSDQLAAATEPYQEMQAAFRKVQEELGQLAEEDHAYRATKQKADELLAQLQERTNDFLRVRDDFQAARQEVLQSNVRPDQLQRVLELSTKTTKGRPVSQRAQALNDLREGHPGRAGQIDAVVAAWEAYEAVKGPLDDPQDLIALLRGSGVLEFRIAPGTNFPDAQRYRQQLSEAGPRAGRDEGYRWFEIDDLRGFLDNDEAFEKVMAEPETVGRYFSRYVVDYYDGRYYILLANTPDKAITRNDEGWELTQAFRDADSMNRPAVSFRLNDVGGSRMGQITGPHTGMPMAILLDNKVISAPNLQSKITNSGIITGNFSSKDITYLLQTLKAGSLEGQLGDYPISIKTTGPAMGADNLNRGLSAAVYALITVAVFMAIYYVIAGLIADFALVANVIVILGVMATLNATFTLPGIAGIVLTIGMAVDANVLIFERIREELNAGAELATAVRLGFEKAFSTIIDANITTFITCVVLYYTATTEIKGFAITLMCGIIATLFASLYCSRVLVTLYFRFTRAKNLSMLPTLVPAVNSLLSPKVNWVAKRYVFFFISATLMVAGLSMVYVRGSDMLDIEFRSGTQVTFDISPEAEGPDSLEISEVRSRLEEWSAVGQKMQQPGFDAASLSDEEKAIYAELQPIDEEAQDRRAKAQADYDKARAEGRLLDAPGEPVDWSLLKDASVVTVGGGEGTKASSFSIATLITDSQAVSATVKAAFDDVLKTTRPLEFEGSDVERVERAPVHVVDSRTLGESINMPTLTKDVREYYGGVAIVLDDLSPAASVNDVTGRIRRMRLQPVFESLGYRPFEVIPDNASATGERTSDDEPLYTRLIVVSRDTNTNYAENPMSLTDVDGLAATEWKLTREALHRDVALASVSNFSSQVSGTMQKQAISAMALSLLAVVVYIWLRFGSIRYGLAAIAALVHDVAIALGLVAISGWLYDNEIGALFLLDPFKIDLALVAACLTIVGYSLNDTIVVFDRIRENRGRLAHATEAIINDSINQTISRTVLTSGTTLIALAVLYTVGGPGVHGFAFAMIIGVLVGTYSSIAVAAPLLLIGAKHEKKAPAATPATAS